MGSRKIQKKTLLTLAIAVMVFARNAEPHPH